MNLRNRAYTTLFLSLFFLWGSAQDVAFSDPLVAKYYKARTFAFEGNLKAARDILEKMDTTGPKGLEPAALLARIYCWEGNHGEARKRFNRITSMERHNVDVWINAIKNELYAKNDATALGLANKALFYLQGNKELERLRTLATRNVESKIYPELGPNVGIVAPKRAKRKPKAVVGTATEAAETKTGPKTNEAEREKDGKKVLNNRIGIRNSFTIFDAVYDPMIYSSISYRRQTLAGSIIPRINYSNRLGKNGVQYDLDFYPKFSKTFYAYINYGYSNASIYPDHKIGGDLYANLPWAMEFSAGMRYIKFDTKNVTVITNSLGHYRGNYYFSLRSYITPQPNNLTRISGNLLIRKYFRDGENFLGLNVGMGYSPELRQLRDGDELLAETLLYIESQRMSLQYQFTPKKSPNIYVANLGVARQELSFDTGNFFWAVSAGITYHVKF